jgi:hypothetical protein
VQLKTKETSSLNNGFDAIVAFYSSYRHIINTVETDAESALLSCTVHLGFKHIVLNHMPPYQHAQRIERYVRTIKDRARAVLDSLPYDLPENLLGELILYVVTLLNDLPNSTHMTLSPRMLVTGTKLNLEQRKAVPFGTLAMFHIAGKEQNKYQPRSELGIVLGPSTRSLHAVRCYIFHTQKVYVRHHFTILDRIPLDFQWKLKTLSKATTMVDNLFYQSAKTRNHNNIAATHNTNSSTIVNNPPTQYDIEEDPTSAEEGMLPPRDDNYYNNHSSIDNNIIVNNDVVDKLFIPPQFGSSVVDNNNDNNNVGVDNIDDNLRNDDNNHNYYNDIDVFESLSTDNGSHDIIETTELDTAAMIDNNVIESLDSAVDASNVDSVNNNNVITQQTDVATHHHNNNHNNVNSNDNSLRKSLRERKSNWRDGPAVSRDRNFKDLYRISVSDALSGTYALQSRQAVIDEIKNMLDYQVGTYVRYDDVKDKRNIVSSFMFIKHKHKPDGEYDKTKARLLANGAKQSEHLYDIISSSTVNLPSVFMLFNIASQRRMHMCTYDIKGAFLNAEFTADDEPIYIIIRKDIASIWIELDPSAAEYLNAKGELLLLLSRFLYGLKQSPLKFQNHLRETLKNCGYHPCIHDECIYIKCTDDGKLSILSTHVDDILQIADDESLIKELHNALIDTYKDITYHSDVDSYLGMTIVQSSDRSVIKLSQKGLIKKLLEQYLDDKLVALSTPATPDLFELDDASPRLDNAKEFLSIVMSLMYVARLTRPDLLLAVTFLASRAHCTTLQDMSKLIRVLRYLKGTIDLPLIINCNDLKLSCYCDAGYGSHPDGKSHSGYIINMGSSDKPSYIMAKSSKQKLTAVSSTDAEILAVVDCLKTVIWLRNLLDELRIIELHTIPLCQDNKSAIWMVTEPSKLRRSKHILIKLSYIKDFVINRSISMIYCKTEEMTADIHTKPLMGARFIQHRNKHHGFHHLSPQTVEPYNYKTSDNKRSVGKRKHDERRG